MNGRIAVVGSNSFSGASFVRYCLEQGLEVLGTSRSDEPAPAFLPYRWLSIGFPRQSTATPRAMN